ncbi:MAG TPA: hypothetical protein VL200_08530 [Lacunisphaera sp.]|nr:hypothetical protein [Lacunisphaera sp.]
MARRLGILSLWLAGAALALVAYWLLFTVFMAYDDEGYVLISLRNYSAHGGLYAQVYSQYGPFFYVLHDLGHRVLGYAFTNTNARLITVLCWLGSAAACAALVWRQTRSVALAGFTLGLSFFHLWLMVSEPGHPGGLIAVLVALGAWAGAGCIVRLRLTALAVVTGLVTAALLLTKINVGIFLLAGAGAWFAVKLANPREARLASAAAVILLAVLPIALMHAKLDDAWGRVFCGQAVVAAVTMFAVAWRERSPATTWRQAGWTAVAGAGLGAAVLVAVVVRGTTARELLEGILLGPLRHPGVYSFAPAWKAGATIAGIVSLLLAARRWWQPERDAVWLILLLRLGLVLAYALACLEWTPFTAHSLTMSYLVPLAWVFAVRLAPADPAAPPRVATWIGLLLVLQYLHAYPVAGSQVAWGTFLIVPLMALGLHDAGRLLAARGASRAPAAVAVAALALAVGATGRLAVIGEERYAASEPLRLHGAAGLRLPEGFASGLRVLALNATAHGDMLFSFPGMFSFNAWTGLPPPTLADTTHWFTLLNPAQQAEIAAALDRAGRPVIVVQRGLLDFLAANGFSTASPLEKYLHAHFAPAFALEQYEFWVRRGRDIVPLGTAEVQRLAAPVAGLPAERLQVIAALPPGSTVARIELAALDEPVRVIQRWTPADAPLEAVGLDLSGRSLVTLAAAWERPLPPIARLSLALPRMPDFDPRHAVVYVRDARGTLLAEARFTN